MRVFFCGGLRTPFLRATKGKYADVRADDLLVELLQAQCSRHANLKSFAEDVVVGCAYPEGEQGYNIARIAALGAGLDVTGCTVNRLCASSMEAAAIAAGRVQAEWGQCYLVAGIESMSRIPRRGANFSESDQIKKSHPFAYVPNGATAEKVAAQYPNLDREQQEDFAARSHELADAAYQQGNYSNQIHTYLADKDEFIRVPVNREKIASLKPAFDENGVVTAATSSPLTDGASSGWILSEDLARDSEFESGLEIVDIVTSHVEPDVMGMGPVPATRKLFERSGLAVEKIAAFEINEAFAIQVLASMEELGIPQEKVNCWGGALALGHPLGASGLRLVMTLHDRLSKSGEDGDFGIATLCVGGGQGMSMLFRFVKF